MADAREHAQGGDLPPVTPDELADRQRAELHDAERSGASYAELAELQARQVLEGAAAKADAARAALGRLELVTVVGAGGLPLERMIAVVDGAGQVLAATAVPGASETGILALWQKVCVIMAEAFDDTTGTYLLERRTVDEQGRPVPGAS